MLIDECGKIPTEVRNRVGFCEVDRAGSGRKVPNQIVGNKTPRQKVI